MTLYRQLITSILVIFILLALTVPTLSITTLKSHIQHQAASQLTHDLITAEMALKPYLSRSLAHKIAPVAEIIFANHNWQHMKLLLLHNDQSIERTRPESDSAVPGWFLGLNLFEPQSQTRSIGEEFRPLARLSITTNTEPLYLELWQAGIKVLYLSLASLAIAFTAVLTVVKYRLKPLAAIVLRAREISSNQSVRPIPLPASADLRTIVKAINHLSTRLESNFNAQAREAVKLREQVYRDNVSGLGNRHYFINQLNSWLANSHKGGLAIMKTTIIDDSYRNHGFAGGDQLVSQIATGLNEGIIASDITLARLSYDEFAVLAPDISADKLRLVGENMLTVIKNIQPIPSEYDSLQAHVGLVMNTTPSCSNTLLSQLDNALSQAALTPATPIALIEETSSHSSFGKQQWKSLVIDAIDNDFFTYHFQPVVTENNGVYQHEVFTAIDKNGDSYSASQFLGAIEDLGIGSLFDRHVIAQLVNRLNADPHFGPLAINITSSSITNPAFIRWLSQILERNQVLSSRLFFELPESCFVRHPDATGLLCSAIRFYHFRFGVDNYGRHFKSLDYLKEFRPDYVKIDFGYTHQLNDPTKSRVLSSISRTAHSLNIMTIATRVETETQLERLSDLFVSGFQGYIVERQCQETGSGNGLAVDS